MRDGAVKLLRDERHKRVQQLEDVGQDIEQDILRVAVALAQAGLGYLDVPVAEAVPDKVVYLRRGNAELVFVEVLIDLAHKLVELRDDPAILQPQRLRQAVFRHVQIHHDIAGGVPELVGEVAHGLTALDIEAHIVAGGVAGDDVEAQRVRTKAVDHFQRVNAVSGGFGHFLALTVADEAVDEDGVERLAPGLLQAGEDHTRHPEEDDVIARHKHIRREEVFIILRLGVRPAQRGERPEGA